MIKSIIRGQSHKKVILEGKAAGVDNNAGCFFLYDELKKIESYGKNRQNLTLFLVKKYIQKIMKKVVDIAG